ncbi:MAG TPA: folylpolyglutamate synthase/dihydrofolate synthase family protein [Jatrophihabitans sp.]
MPKDWAALRREVEREIFHRRGEGHIDPSNERMLTLVDLLGNPQRAFRAIHITGTNGKTSTARIADELLRAFGLRVGRYTSPHLTKVTERIVIDGEPVDDRTFVEHYDRLAPLIAMVDGQYDSPCSFFEIITALGFAIFAEAPVDVAVVEVGMGGTWDNTNVLDGEVAVITPIDLDHMQYLGDTVAAIAKEKAGIIKPTATAIIASQPVEAAAELLKRAVEVDAAVAREGLEFGVLERRVAVGGQVLQLQGLGGEYEDVFLPLYGAHQAQNAGLALAAVEAFFGKGGKNGALDVDIVRAALAEATSPGRLETVRSAPTVLVDAAHNKHGMAASLAALSESFSFRRLVAVVAVLADKDAKAMLELLEPVVDEIVVSQNSSPRALDVDELAALAVDVFGDSRVSVELRLDDAIDVAVTLAEETGDNSVAGSGVLVTGSVITAGEARALLGALGG